MFDFNPADVVVPPLERKVGKLQVSFVGQLHQLLSSNTGLVPVNLDPFVEVSNAVHVCSLFSGHLDIEFRQLNVAEVENLPVVLFFFVVLLFGLGLRCLLLRLFGVLRLSLFSNDGLVVLKVVFLDRMVRDDDLTAA